MQWRAVHGLEFRVEAKAIAYLEFREGEVSVGGVGITGYLGGLLDRGPGFRISARRDMPSDGWQRRIALGHCV